MELAERLQKAKQTIFENAYGRLNDKQRQAVFTTEGPLLVLAGAGSGKTTVLVKRISHLVRYGNAYFGTACDERMLSEPFVQKLEALAAEPDADKAMTEAALAMFADHPARPYEILAITFTNKAANEIKDRLASELGEQADDVWAGTFHSVCVKLLRMYSDRIGYERSFTIYDTDDQKRLMTAIIKDNNLNDKTFPVRSVLNEISRAKEQLLDSASYAANVRENDLRRRTISRLYEEYEKRKKAANAMDFDDLIRLTVKLFEEDKELLEKYRKKFRYILVDEYQDTNKAQFVLTSMLTGEERNIMVVGDDDQSIYKFRGATIENILGFDKTFPGTKIIRLEQNYRSTGVIVKAANEVIAHNQYRKGKTLWTGNETGEKITVCQCNDQNAEAQYIVNCISELVAAGEYRFEDFAVLYRMNSQSNALETVFAKSGIPYRIIGGTRFYERKEIKDVIAYLCVMANPGDNLRLKRIINVPKRGIGDSTVEELERIAAAEGKDMLFCALNAASYPSLGRSAAKLAAFAEMMYGLKEGYAALPVGVCVEKVLAKSGYMEMLAALDEAEAKDRSDNVKELVSNATQYGNNTPDATLEGFLEEVALVADIDNYEKEASAVVMMTVHSAKGLEFPVVFLPGMEEGVFPGTQTIAEADEEMEEERRLAYVALTRAQKKLYVVHCRTRMIFGRTEFHQKSRFAEEIPEDLCEMRSTLVDITYDRPTVRSSYDLYGRPSFGAKEKKTTGSVSAFSARTEKGYMQAQAGKKADSAPTERFAVGTRVAHPVFGEGTVLSAKPMSSDVLYEVAFDSVGTKKIMGNFAKMKRA